ncbi:unnamed protein product [Arabidopsis thaliana]|uniref:(thale cress) hypothetical protein n=1 Tax=Arabidopsis thaliana TaxID=3702 RepID=A0A7G2E0N9_ARATH|nr:unnamed protein product [Arabidopsis thaliana]
MVKIYPHLAFPVDMDVVQDKILPYLTTEQERFTIWMKSLVFNSKGCTVFDSKGNLIYRVDNYDSKSWSNEVYFMDLNGKILFTLRQKIVNRGSVFAIKDGSGRLMAEVKNKLSDISGLDLGDDVLTMMVVILKNEPSHIPDMVLNRLVHFGTVHILIIPINCQHWTTDRTQMEWTTTQDRF